MSDADTGDPRGMPSHSAQDQAPGQGTSGDGTSGAGSIAGYTAGLVFALLLTGASFMVAQTHLLWAPGLPVGLAVLAIAQMGVHLVFFLHISSGPDNTNNVLALAFGVLIVTLVVSGTLWIMSNLDANMIPDSAIMNMQ